MEAPRGQDTGGVQPEHAGTDDDPIPALADCLRYPNHGPRSLPVTRRGPQCRYDRRMHPDARSALLRRLVAYVAVGAVGTVVYLGVYNGLRSVLAPLVANAVATLVALCISFWGNRRLAFGVAGIQGLARDFVLFSVVFFGTLAVSSLALVGLFALVEAPGRLAENAALLLATAITFVLRYVLLRRWVFPEPAAGTASLPPRANLER